MPKPRFSVMQVDRGGVAWEVACYLSAGAACERVSYERAKAPRNVHWICDSEEEERGDIEESLRAMVEEGREDWEEFWREECADRRAARDQATGEPRDYRDPDEAWSGKAWPAFKAPKGASK